VSTTRVANVTPIADIRKACGFDECPSHVTRKACINHECPSPVVESIFDGILAEGTFGREISEEKDIYVSIDASCIVVEDNPRIGISARRPLSRRAKNMQYKYIKHLRHATVLNFTPQNPLGSSGHSHANLYVTYPVTIAFVEVTIAFSANLQSRNRLRHARSKF